MERWVSLINGRGIAGIAARETPEEKMIVERSMLSNFVETIEKINNLTVANIIKKDDGLPDFGFQISGEEILIELTEFIDPKFLQKAGRFEKPPRVWGCWLESGILRGENGRWRGNRAFLMSMTGFVG